MSAAALKDTGTASYQMDLRLPWIMAGDHASRFATCLALEGTRLAVDCAARTPGLPRGPHRSSLNRQRCPAPALSSGGTFGRL